MEKPKCKLCNERHWGGCANPEPSRLKTGDHVSIGGEEHIFVAAHVSARVSEQLAPPNECPYCDARRAKTAEAVRLHRAKRKITAAKP